MPTTKIQSFRRDLSAVCRRHRIELRPTESGGIGVVPDGSLGPTHTFRGVTRRGVRGWVKARPPKLEPFENDR